MNSRGRLTLVKGIEDKTAAPVERRAARQSPRLAALAASVIDVAKPERLVAALRALPRARLTAMAAAGREAADCLRVLAKTDDNVVGEVLRGSGAFTEWEHYPPDDVYDPVSHAQYYYHAHPPEDRGFAEHGHFHLLLRPRGMPRGVRPAPTPGGAAPAGADDAPSHLVAISMDEFGAPVRLFTTNRWVTAETWYSSADVSRMLDNFVVDLARPNWAVNRWITAMVRVFRPQIDALLEARDRAISAWAAAHPGGDVYEDRRLDITSMAPISLERQIAAIDAARSRSGGKASSA